MAQNTQIDQLVQKLENTPQAQRQKTLINGLVTEMTTAVQNNQGQQFCQDFIAHQQQLLQASQ